MLHEHGWSQVEFGGVDLGDLRRTRRAVKVGAAMAMGASSGVLLPTASAAEAKAAYRFFDEDDVTHEAITEPHRKRVIGDASRIVGPVLFVHDDTTLDFSFHRAMVGIGPVGDHRGRGLIAHSCLAVTPDGGVIGLAHQAVWAREDGTKPKESKWQRMNRRTEAAVWEECVSAIGPCPIGSTWVSIGDRGSDVYSHFIECRNIGWQCLVRVCQNRALVGGGCVIKTARAMEAMAARAIDVNGESIELSVAWFQTELRSPAMRPGVAASPFPCSVVRVWNDEADLEWILLSSLPVTTAAEAWEKTDWYRRRWMIEEFHKALKTGCTIEKSQLRTAGRFRPLLGMASIVAVRLLQFRSGARTNPDAPTDEPRDTIVVLAHLLDRSEETLRTRRGFIRGVAALGKFLGRKSDGEPGWITIWRGWSILQHTLRGFHLAGGLKRSKCG